MQGDSTPLLALLGPEYVPLKAPTGQSGERRQDGEQRPDGERRRVPDAEDVDTRMACMDTAAETISELTAVNEALETENGALKARIEYLLAQRASAQPTTPTPAIPISSPRMPEEDAHAAAAKIKLALEKSERCWR